MAVAVPPLTKVMLVVVSDRAGPLLMFGEIAAKRVMVPANPFRLVTLIAELADCPLMMLSDVGLALIEKVGGAEIVNDATVEWDKLPLVPVTLTLNVPVGPPTNEVRVKVEDAVPPEDNATLVGLTLQPGQLAQASCGEVAKLTVPLNPLKLVRTIEEVALAPAFTF